MEELRPELVGRERERKVVEACLKAGRNVLLEGPVGVGKTHLALTVADGLKVPVFRVDGDSRYTEQKLTGWFDPPTVMATGYARESFVPGPLVEAMETGGLLFINELNRMPEGVQNVLLPAVDEKLVHIPRLGEIRAKTGFRVLATQNPKEFVGTSHLSEAILDRFEWISLGYQTEADEVAIVNSHCPKQEALAQVAVRLIRLTRAHPRIRRGASVRAAIAIAEIAQKLMEDAPAQEFDSAFVQAALLALPTRVELERDGEKDAAQIEEFFEQLAHEALMQKTGANTEEKKSPQ